jgi:hypothetical protein
VGIAAPARRVIEQFSQQLQVMDVLCRIKKSGPAVVRVCPGRCCHWGLIHDIGGGLWCVSRFGNLL